MSPIDLNRHVKGQKLDGLAMLNFNSGVSDPTRTREAMSYAFFRDAGLPAPRTSFVELALSVPDRYDQELVGVFTLVEQVGKAFLEKHFQDGRGMLLKPEGLQGGLGHRGDDWKAYEAQYHPETEPTEEEQQRLIDFTRLIDLGTDKEFAAEIGSYLEVDAFLRFIAANTLLANLDSYLGYGHNYYLYLVPGTKKFVFIPWDLDLSLATWPAVGTPEQLVELSIHHPHSGQNKLIERLFAIPDHKQRYLEILRELCQTVFTEEAFVMRLAEFESELKAPLAAEAKAVAGRNEGRGGGGFGAGFGGGGGQFGQSMPTRRFITLRTKSVADQLAGQAKGFEPRAFGMGFGGPPPGGRPAGRPMP
ncbi:MAG: CotH kinase family protein [Planctomycetota bacterium]|nr:CotH kinase family protein [Planctomycetota bacterium]